MVHTTVGTFFKILGIVAIAFVLVVPLLAWRLSNAPIALDVLTPYVQEALTPTDRSFAISMDRTVLAWSDESRLFEIRALGVRVDRQGQAVAYLPELGVSLSGRALLTGQIALRSIKILHPSVSLIREADGTIAWVTGQDDTTRSSLDFPQVLAFLQGQDSSSLSHIRRLHVAGAKISLDDRRTGLVWYGSAVDLDFTRLGQDVLIKADMRLVAPGREKEAALNIDARYAASPHDATKNAIDLIIRTEHLPPAVFAPLSESLQALKAIDLPLSGRLEAGLTQEGSLRSLAFDINGDAGTLALPLENAMPLAVSGLQIKGRSTQGLNAFSLSTFSLDLGGPRLEITAQADASADDMQRVAVKADAHLTNVPVSRLSELWPHGLAANARDWVVTNIRQGRVDDTKASVTLSFPKDRPQDLSIETIAGELTPRDLSVRYLAGLPEATAVSGRATFDHDRFSIAVDSGQAGPLLLSDGKIVFSNLHQSHHETAEIALKISGSAKDALILLDSKPLGYAKALGLDPAQVGGDQVTLLTLKFPLLKDLAFKDVSILAQSRLAALSIPKILMGQDLTQSRLDLTIDAKGLEAKGDIVLGGTPARLEWRENFGTAPFRSRYHVQGVFHEADRKRFGLDSPPFIAPFMEGPVFADIVATMQSGGTGQSGSTGTIEARADLSQVAMTLPGLGWSKAGGISGWAEASLRLQGDKVAAIPAFNVAAGDLQAAGRAAFTPQGAIARIEFDKMLYARTQARGVMAFPSPNLIAIDLSGDSFDAAPILHDKSAKARADDAADHDLPSITIEAAFDRLWLSEAGFVTAAKTSLARAGKDWRHIDLHALAQDKPVRFQLSPADTHRRRVTASSDEAGALFRALGLFDDMRGGTLRLSAMIDDAKPDQPMSGSLHVADYKVVNTPILAQLLSIAALTGVVDVLQGDGLRFTRLDAPFTLTDGLLDFKEARAFGPSLGITANGQADLDNDVIAVEGTLVPAYALNSILGNIPLLGPLLTGDKGSGVFAASYTLKGPLDGPDMTVNPLSALTPGVLRKIFNILDPDAGRARPHIEQ